MRRTLSLTLFAIGALTMPADAQNDPQWTEQVTVKRYAGQPAFEFSDPHAGVSAYRKQTADGLVIFLKPGPLSSGGTPGGKPPVKSLVTDKDGNTYCVTKVTGSTLYACAVAPVKN